MMRQTSQRAAAGGRQYVFHDGMDSRGQAERCVRFLYMHSVCKPEMILR